MDEPSSFYEEVGRRIRDERKRRKPPMTQQELADKVSLTRTSITNVEKGRQKFLLHTLADIAAALQVHPSSLLPEVNGDGVKQLDEALKNRSKSEKEWIKSAVTAVQKGKVDDGS